MSKAKNILVNLYAYSMVLLALSLAALFTFKMETCGKKSDQDNVKNNDEFPANNISTGERLISGDGFVGFTSLDDLKRATDLFNDIEALDEFIAIKVKTSNATFFVKGEIVYFEEVNGVIDRSIKIRRKGGTTSFWTLREAIK